MVDDAWEFEAPFEIALMSLVMAAAATVLGVFGVGDAQSIDVCRVAAAIVMEP